MKINLKHKNIRNIKLGELKKINQAYKKRRLKNKLKW